jgi:GNAT superfamily N-acetyltransferase
MRNDLLDGRTWLVWDDATVAGTITLDTEEPRAANGKPVWPAHKRHGLAVYVRRVIVRRRYAHLGIGAALLDWAAEAAKRDHGATRIRVDVWTTNRALHTYYEQLGFTRCPPPDPGDRIDYPSQALFERQIEQAGASHAKLFVQADSHSPRIPRWRTRIDRLIGETLTRGPGRDADRTASGLAYDGVPSGQAGTCARDVPMIVAHSEHRIAVVEDGGLALGLAAGRVVQTDAGAAGRSARFFTWLADAKAIAKTNAEDRRRLRRRAA